MKHSLFTILVLTISLSATTINIPGDYSAIQAGIDAAVHGDTILVQPGTYVENINFNGKSIAVVSTFIINKNGSKVSETIIDGNKAGSVVTFSNNDHGEPKLIGFTLTNGSGNYNGYQDWGGGINCSNSKPKLQNLIIKNNDSEYAGGIYIGEGSEVNIENVIIHDNKSMGGTGIWCHSSWMAVVNVTITNNISSEPSGGMAIQARSTAFLYNVIIWDNFPEQVTIENSLNKVSFYHCNIEGGEAGLIFNETSNDEVNWGDGNIGENPQLNETKQLTNTSPCIGSGTLTPELPYDIVGNPRPNPPGSNPDMGAYESTLGTPNEPVSVSNVSTPTEYQLSQNYPNPFNPTTTISYELPEQSAVSLTVYDIRGQEITTLQNGAKPPGNYEVQWNGLNESGSPVSTGVYFARLQAGDYNKTIKMVLLK